MGAYFFMPATKRYSKPWLSIGEQIARLRSRGLIIVDEDAAARQLAHLNYYRFSGYALPFQIRNGERGERVFKQGTKFEDVIRVYQFDCKLRDLMFEASEAVEIDLRGTIAYSFGKAHGAFGHVDSANFVTLSRQIPGVLSPSPVFSHARWKEKVQAEARRASDLFITHYKNVYREFPDLPIWMLTEVCSFGSLSEMFANLKQCDRTPIANQYGLQALDAASIIHHLVYVRNICAHHARLWDRLMSIRSRVPPGKRWDVLRHSDALPDAYTALVFHKWMFMSSKVPAEVVDDWCGRVNTLIAGIRQDLPSLFANDYVTHGLASDPIWNGTCNEFRNRKAH